MSHFSVEIYASPGSTLSGNQQSAPIAVFDRMKRASLVTLLRKEVGDASADNCATIKKKADLAVNVSGRLPGKWLPEPMQIGAFDMPDEPQGEDMENIEVDEAAAELA